MLLQYLKKGTIIKKENYRPVNMLSTFSKVFEKLLFEQINDHMQSKFSKHHLWLLIWCKIHVFVFREKFNIQRNIFLFRGSFVISEFLCISKTFHIQRNFITFSYFFCYIQTNFSYSEKNLSLRKLYIQRKSSLC